MLDAIAVMLEGATRRGFKWTRREQWHVTIQYFGRVDDADALVGALAGAVATVPAAGAQLGGAGGFPSDRRASVYWLGVLDPEPLGRVHDAVIDAADDWVRPRDRVRYVPHLTLARMNSAKRLTEEVSVLAGVPIGPPFTVDEVVLLESETRRDGAVYHEIARMPLA